MIKRKIKISGKKYSFWSHYHKSVELSNEGNQELLERLNSCNSKTELERFYILANIPEKFFKFTFEEIKQPSVRNVENVKTFKNIEKYLVSLDSAVSKGIGLYIHGPHGVAKTTLSIIILKKAIQESFRCFFWKSSDIVDFIKSSWKSEYRRLFFDYIINTVDFLVIDDIARLFDDYKGEEKLYIDKIFTKRDDMNLVTILTANQSLEHNQSLFGDALYSNFKERLIDIPIVGDDFRNQIGQKLLKQL